MFSIDLREKDKQIYSGHLKMGGVDVNGRKISVNNYYIEIDGEPFIAVIGEFHFSRYPYHYWEESILKMKMGGINAIASYIFWNYHEEEMGVFDWNGNNNLRHFVDLCAQHDMQVILRIGPFAHGEVRNGGMPDWLYGRPFDIRSNDEGYLYYARRFYNEIATQVTGHMFTDGGPVIGIQLENEFMAASAPWELAYKQVFYMSAGRDGVAHMIKLKDMAIEAGFSPAFFTCTAWGSPIIEREILPMFGGYAFTPWVPDEDFIQPPTGNYVFSDLHRQDAQEKTYDPSEYPFGNCEMGGGIQITYAHRPIVPAESVEAMSVVKLGSGSNLIGYYMYHGGSNRIGKHGYLNEYCVPKISYDFQAPIREFGQLATSYRYLRTLFLFLADFGHLLAPMATVIPKSANHIVPTDTTNLRFCARVKSNQGFLFLNNYQDHVDTEDIRDITFELDLSEEKLVFPRKSLTLKKDTCAILPFNIILEDVLLKYATSQLLTKIELDNSVHYFFYAHPGVTSEFCFDSNTLGNLEVKQGDMITKGERSYVIMEPGTESLISIVSSSGKCMYVTVLTRKEALQAVKVHIWGSDRLIISEADVICKSRHLELYAKGNCTVSCLVYPAVVNGFSTANGQIVTKSDGLFTQLDLLVAHKEIELDIRRVGEDRCIIYFPSDLLEDINDVFLHVNFVGDVGNAFIDGTLISDNFYNGTTWEIGLKRFASVITRKGMYLYITPIRKGKIERHADMAAVEEFIGTEFTQISSIVPVPEYKFSIGAKPL